MSKSTYRYSKTCLDCGVKLDPGERCDCHDKRWFVEMRMPSGNVIQVKVYGTENGVRAHYAALGGEVLRIEKSER